MNTATATLASTEGDTMFSAPTAPRTLVTTGGIVKPSHAQIAAWMHDSHEFYLAEAAQHVAMAEKCDGSACTVSEHLTDAREAMEQAERFAPVGA